MYSPTHMRISRILRDREDFPSFLRELCQGRLCPLLGTLPWGVLTELKALDLASCALGQLVHKFDEAGILVFGKSILHVVFEFFFELVGCFISITEHHIGLGFDKAFFVAFAHHSGFEHRGMFYETVLDFQG